MKKVKVIKTKTAVIIVLIEFILVMTVVMSYIEKFYQKEYEQVPEIAVYYKGKEMAKLLPVEYHWTYKGKTDDYSIPMKEAQGEITEYRQRINYGDFDFSEENTIIISTNENKDYIRKMPERHKMEKCYSMFYSLTNCNNNSGGLNATGDTSKRYLKGIAINEYSPIKVGEYVYTETIDFLKQGKVNYCLKVIAFDEEDAKVAKNYLDTSLDNIQKIEELARNIKFKELLQSVKVEGNNLILEYDYHIEGDDTVRMNNLIFFACIPDLETVIYLPKNKKTIIQREENNFESEKVEIENVVYTREKVDNESLANTTNLKKFMEQI